MSFTILNGQGQPVKIHSCLSCGEPNRGDQVICGDCGSCPRCGSSFVLGAWKEDPILMRCMGCMKGWTLPVQAIEGVVPERNEEELAFFAYDPGQQFDQVE